MRKKIKNIIFKIVIAFSIIIVFVSCSYVEHNYSITGTVYKIDNENIYFIDSTDEIWIYENDNKNFSLNDNVIIYFNDNNSEQNRYDDIITNVIKRE